MSLKLSRRRTLSLLGATLSAIAWSVTPVVPADAAPPNIPSKPVAQSELGALTVASEGSMAGYSRDRFPHWIAISGNCDTRETVLKRDGSGVVVDGACYPTSGSWYSPYDGASWTNPADVDIDHLVPLAEAWRSGASSWTTSKRQSFANDLGYPQLIAVTDNVNLAKGDRDPSTWQPPLAAYKCTYGKIWIRSKYHWGLALQSSEKSALQGMLNTCSS